MTEIDTAALSEIKSTPGRAGGRLSTILGLSERYGILIAWAVMVAAFSLAAPQTFPTVTNFQTIFGSQSVLLLLTISVIVTLNAGEFDLSPGSALGFASTAFAYLNVRQHVPLVLSILIVLALAVAFGALNVLLVVGFHVPSTVATLGSGTLLAGLGLALSSQLISGVDAGFISVIRYRIAGLPTAFYIALGVCALVYYVLQHTPFGRHWIFVGKSREVARLAGVRVTRMRAIAFIVSAIITFSAGILLVGFTGSADPTSGPSMLLPAFAAAFLGETAIRPGQFNVWGSFVAVYFLVTGVTGLELLGVSGWVEQVFYGLALVLAVTIVQLISLVRRRHGQHS